MSILRDMFTALRGAGNEVGESIVDANAVRILEQEIRDAEVAISKARQSLTRLKGTEIKLKREINTLETDIADYEAKAMEALNAGNEAMATKVAERIAELEGERDEQAEEHRKLASEVTSINTMIKNRNKIIQKNKRELEKVKTVKELQKTTTSITSNIAATGSSQHRVQRALERVKSKQQTWQDNMEAGEWMENENGTDDLDRELKAAGIGDTASKGSSVLERLKAKQAAG